VTVRALLVFTNPNMHVLGMYCVSWWGSVSFYFYFYFYFFIFLETLFLCLLSDFSKTRSHISITFCGHLEHCQVRVEFAFQYCGIPLEMTLSLKAEWPWWTSDAVGNDVGFFSLGETKVCQLWKTCWVTLSSIPASDWLVSLE
jgi:hypothetical protein